MSGSEAVTRGIRVGVEARYVPERSEPEQQRWFFVYRVRITNESDERVQLISRHWIITDAVGEVEEVKGPGVVGAQPVLDPGTDFEYTSFCPLPTPFGSMRGTYQMMTEQGEEFDVTIATFALNEPLSIN
ncbi:MAG: Co2+/Mg2+ efflux protein ApaG [Acidobacteriota bacterium]|nr:Co2+/Mg2+ efflux protein ApaG [Acidobacteriota bacterium]